MTEADVKVKPYRVKLELVDEPGELLRALRPISNEGGNLLSIFHERGKKTPRGHIPVEVDIEATPTQFDRIVDALQSAGVNVIEAGSEQYQGELTIVLVGHLVDTDLSDTLKRIQDSGEVSITDVALSTPFDQEGITSARLRLSANESNADQILPAIRAVTEEKDIEFIEPALGDTQ